MRGMLYLSGWAGEPILNSTTRKDEKMTETVDVTALMSDEMKDAVVKGEFFRSSPKPSTINVEKKRPKSTPVRNPAFREHEGLKALQKQLNSRGTK